MCHLNVHFEQILSAVNIEQEAEKLLFKISAAVSSELNGLTHQQQQKISVIKAMFALKRHGLSNV